MTEYKSRSKKKLAKDAQQIQSFTTNAPSKFAMAELAVKNLPISRVEEETFSNRTFLSWSPPTPDSGKKEKSPKQNAEKPEKKEMIINLDIVQEWKQVLTGGCPRAELLYIAPSDDFNLFLIRINKIGKNGQILLSVPQNMRPLLLWSEKESATTNIVIDRENGIHPEIISKLHADKLPIIVLYCPLSFIGKFTHSDLSQIESVSQQLLGSAIYR